MARPRSQAAPGTPATVALTAAGIPFTPRAYAHDASVTAYGLEAAAALGVEPVRVFKTLLAEADGRLVVGVVPVSAKLDLKALASAVGAKRAAMAAPELAERKTGYVVGGISPIGQKTALPTVIDESAALWETVLVSGGRRGFDLELAPADLLRATGGVLGDIAQ
ncbi:Cys-tRNA(Pro) deacylase [Microcella alkalica]|uniref:Cys-tRNA(Pro)/Cys-tRNA(Cys) deacylase n=1 Tax=Microcella alkalica TaxID=355930 RepID=A0A839EA28_9MICO|nr:Cys-tRNA(Pro) deacylase [Microcella alkalica]MBA8846598.1 Cys-tRNA(Pro)/Cys-tRNA(Cys) deacylase [Microcella alkalica]